MQLHATDPLFAWLRLEDHPALSTLRDLLALLPDEALLQGLRAARGKGRDDYRSEEHTSELQSRPQLVCRLLLEKNKQEGRAEEGRAEERRHEKGRRRQNGR